MGLVIHHEEKYEPLWKGILKIACLVVVVGALVFGFIWFIAGLAGNMEKRQQDTKVQAMEEGNTGREVTLLDQNGTFMGYKMTYEGHDYLKVSNSGGIIHSESCPCKNVEEEEKP